MTQQGSCLTRVGNRLHRLLAYFSVLRPSFIFGAIIVYLPLTAAHESVPGNSMLANLFVEYGFWKAFWFGFAFFGAVWALMLTTCLSLDFARDRQLSNSEQWLPDPGEEYRNVAIPMRDRRTFFLFSLLAVPGGAIVLWRAGSPATALFAFAGLTIGCLLAFLSMNQVAALIYADNEKFPVLPWRPVGLKVQWPARLLRPFFSWSMRFAPGKIFDAKTGLLKDDHFFASLSAAAVAAIYVLVYWFFKPSGFGFPLDNIPPAAFIFALLLPLIWIITALWVYLSPYRLVFLAAVAVTMLLTRLATTHWLESTIGGPSHTYDVVPLQTPMPAQAKTMARQKLIVVAASGGGILAAGWTAHVLTQLHREYGAFPLELGLISSVSGGSVGAAYYLSALDEIVKLTDLTKRDAALKSVADDAMHSSLASTSYGVAFADFRRVVFPFFADEAFDRGRLIEADWRRIANCRRVAIASNLDDKDFEEFCHKQHPDARQRRAWISQLQSQAGDLPPKPAVIFNSTVMETGERIAITPLATLQSKWQGQAEKNEQPVPPRHAHARTLSEFLSATQSSAADDPAKQDIGKKKKGSCDLDQFKSGYDIDTWTAARLSATFSYVSPAARATCADPKRNTRAAAADDGPGRLHLIDGGYHDNYGVASALDWLARQDATGELTYSRIALVEIRAKPDIPSAKEQNEWSSAWLGPFWGLFNSWGFAQTSANDTAINQLIARFKTTLREPKVCIDSFVFVPRWTGPLSWHLSEQQKQQLRDQWNTDSNPIVLKRLLGFLGATGAQACPQ